MNKALDQQKHELEEKRNVFEKEKEAFEIFKNEMEELRKTTLNANSRE